MMKYFLLFILVFLFYNCFNNKNEKIIAKYNSGFITTDQLLKEYNNLSSEDKLKSKNYNEMYKLIRKIALEDIINTKIKEQKIEEDEEFKKQIDDIKKRVAMNILKNKNIFNKIKIIEEDYYKYRKIYEVYQIVKRTDILSEEKIKNNKLILKKLSKEIKTLEQFKTEAKKFSDDISAVDGGYIGFIRLGVMEEEIDNVIKNLPLKKVSDIIETNSTMHIIFINSYKETPLEELLNDRELYEEIYKEKELKYETEWYESLLSDKDLIINKDKLKEKKYDDEKVLIYRDKYLTRNELYKTIDKMREESGFPTPTVSEIEQLVKNIGLNFILDYKINDPNILNSSEFKESFQKEKDYLLKRIFIERNIKLKEIEESDIKNFYNSNIKTLFTFKDENGNDYIQPLNEVLDFIKQKLMDQYNQQARYDLYKNLIDNSNFIVYKEKVEKIINELK